MESRNSLLLDLDCPDDWHSDFQGLVYSRDIWPTIEARLDAPESSFLSQITCSDDYLSDTLARSLRRGAREIMLARYSHVAAYHGCRIGDPESYQRSGILPSNTSALISRARILFRGIEGFDAALKDIGPSYIAYSEGKVGLLFSCIRAKRDRNQYAAGSELIRGLASRLGPDATLRSARTGKRSLIKCAIQTDWLDTHTTWVSTSGGYSNHVLEQLIVRRRWPDDHFLGFDGGYYLTIAVPPENILEFIDMTDFSDDDS